MKRLKTTLKMDIAQIYRSVDQEKQKKKKKKEFEKGNKFFIFCR